MTELSTRWFEVTLCLVSQKHTKDKGKHIVKRKKKKERKKGR